MLTMAMMYVVCIIVEYYHLVGVDTIVSISHNI